jgi:YHS domain-containing protein
LLRYLILVLAGIVLYWIIRGVLRSYIVRAPLERGEHRTVTRGEELVQDPQCGVYLPIGQALFRTVKGREHPFCSERCAGAFLEASSQRQTKEG